MKKFLQIQSGFTLIELMIVIAIIGILSIIAIPSYQNYTKRARFAEVITATAPFKTAIALALQEGFALSDLAAGTHGIPEIPPPTRNLASLSVDAGIITAQSTEVAGNASYILTPDTNGSHWQISGTCLDNQLCGN